MVNLLSLVISGTVFVCLSGKLVYEGLMNRKIRKAAEELKGSLTTCIVLPDGSLLAVALDTKTKNKLNKIYKDFLESNDEIEMAPIGKLTKSVFNTNDVLCFEKSAKKGEV